MTGHRRKLIIFSATFDALLARNYTEKRRQAISPSTGFFQAYLLILSRSAAVLDVGLVAQEKMLLFIPSKVSYLCLEIIWRRKYLRKIGENRMSSGKKGRRINYPLLL